jgi:hypothetical protein
MECRLFADEVIEWRCHLPRRMSPLLALSGHPRPSAGCLLSVTKQTWRFCAASEKAQVKNPETGAYPRCSASSCKSLQPQISRKSAEIPSPGDSRHALSGIFAGAVAVRP